MEQPEKHYSLTRKKAGAAWQATFCYFGELYYFGTNETDKKEAHKKCLEEQLKVLPLLAARARAKGKTVPELGDDAEAKAPDEQAAQSEEAPPPLDRKSPAPKGSFREKIEWERTCVLKTKKSKSRQREGTDSEEHLYEALGGYVDLSAKKMDGEMGEKLAAYYNNPVRFRLVGPTYATHMRRFLKPMVARGELSREFIDALDKVEKQSDDDEKSDPLRGDHFKRMFDRLMLGVEEDFLLGMFLLGCHPAPQIIDVLLLQWEGVDFETGMIKLYREKTSVISESRMSQLLREWLSRRRQAAPKSAVYVFWEVVCLKDEQGKPGFNEAQITDGTRIASISTNGATMWREFMHRAGVPVGLVKFCSGDLLDFDGFTAKLRAGNEPKYSWLFSRLSSVCQKQIMSLPATTEERDRLEDLLIANLNSRVIKGEFAYEEQVAGGTQLRGQTQELKNPGFTGVRRQRFNRLYLEDLFPELRRVEFSNFKYSYSSFRKALVSFLRGIHFRDPVIAAILGQDALDSQNAYDRVAEHEFARGSELSELHLDAMVHGREEFYPSIPYDFFQKMVELFGIQEQAQARLLDEFRRIQIELKRRQDETKEVIRHSGREMQSFMDAKIDAMEDRIDKRLAQIEDQINPIHQFEQMLFTAIPASGKSAFTPEMLIACVRFLLFIFAFVNGSTHQSRFLALIESGAERPGNRKGDPEIEI